MSRGNPDQPQASCRKSHNFSGPEQVPPERSCFCGRRRVTYSWLDPFLDPALAPRPNRFSELCYRAAPCRTYVIIFAFCWLPSPPESLYMTCTLEHCLGRLPWDGRCLLLLGQQRSWLTFPPGVAEFQIDLFLKIFTFFFNFWDPFSAPFSGSIS